MMPHKNPQAHFIDLVEEVDEHYMKMGKGSSSSVGTRQEMATKLSAARIAAASGADMIIANGDKTIFHVIHRLFAGPTDRYPVRQQIRRELLSGGHSGRITYGLTFNC